MVVAPDKPPFYRVAMVNGINSRPVRICRSDHVALWAQDHGGVFASARRWMLQQDRPIAPACAAWW